MASWGWSEGRLREEEEHVRVTFSPDTGEAGPLMVGAAGFSVPKYNKYTETLPQVSMNMILLNVWFASL